MAAFFQSFQASSMPKRLLRYVLSRFELLDPESLDLDNLELNISHKTALEFNNVGIILQVSFPIHPAVPRPMLRPAVGRRPEGPQPFAIFTIQSWANQRGFTGRNLKNTLSSLRLSTCRKPRSSASE